MFFTVAMIIGVMTPYFGMYFHRFTGISAYELTEEAGKAIACLFGAPIAITSTLIFSIGEFCVYVSDFGPACIKVGLLWQFVTLRLVCIGFHMFLVLYQLGGYWLAKTYENKFMMWSTRVMTFVCALE